jgi:hypothetical protein
MNIVPQPSLKLKPGKDGCGGHAWECRSAKTKVSECVCACDGKNHGVSRKDSTILEANKDKDFVAGVFFDNDTCIDCGGLLGNWQNAYADQPESGEWWYRECARCEYQWAEWKLVARGFKPYHP